MVTENLLECKTILSLNILNGSFQGGSWNRGIPLQRCPHHLNTRIHRCQVGIIRITLFRSVQVGVEVPSFLRVKIEGSTI